MSKPIIAYQMTLEIAEKFYLRCEERKAVSTKDRIRILEEIAKECGLVGLNEEDVDRRMIGKKVLRITANESSKADKDK